MRQRGKILASNALDHESAAQCFLAEPELVIDPSGNANEAAVDNRIGSSGLTSLRRNDDALIVARSLGCP